jgi:hypothetical protein
MVAPLALADRDAADHSKLLRSQQASAEEFPARFHRNERRNERRNDAGAIGGYNSL